jgi:hypothetical protein
VVLVALSICTDNIVSPCFLFEAFILVVVDEGGPGWLLWVGMPATRLFKELTACCVEEDVILLELRRFPPMADGNVPRVVAEMQTGFAGVHARPWRAATAASDLQPRCQHRTSVSLFIPGISKCFDFCYIQYEFRGVF